MSDIARTRRRFLRDCTAGAAALTAASYGCGREEQLPPTEPERKLSDVLESVGPDPSTGSSQAVIVKGKYSPLVFTDQIRPRNPGESLSKQLSNAMEQLQEHLKPVRSGWGALVRMNFYVRADETAGAIRAVMARAFQEVHKPVTTFVRGDLEYSDAAFAMDVISLGGEVELPPGDRSADPASFVPSIQRSEHAVVLPYGARLFISGETKPGLLETATRGTLEELEAMLSYAGCEWADVAQLRSFMTPITEAGRVRSIIREYLGDRPIPMLTFVEWRSTANPIEIELVARVPPARAAKMTGQVEFLNPPGAAKSPVFSRAAIVNTERLLFTSGFYGDGDDTAARIRHIFGQVRTLVEQSGGNLDQLVKATYYVQDAESSKLLNEIRPEFYNPERPPAASKAIVRGVGRNDRKITVDMIAAAN